MREQIARNPLTVLPSSSGAGEPLRAESAEMVGNYALRITFSDGHRTGLYSWDYLRQIDPANQEKADQQPIEEEGDPDSGGAASDGC